MSEYAYGLARARERRLSTLREMEINFTGPLGVLNPFEVQAERLAFFGSLTTAQRTEFMLYHSYERHRLN